MRSAGQDRYEQGDCWAKAAALRRSFQLSRLDVPPRQWRAFVTATDRFITADTSQRAALRGDGGKLEFASEWLATFEHAGRSLGTLSANGQLTRGIRAIIAHHIIFHWNRIGLSPKTQADLADAATEAIFKDEPATLR